MLSCFAAIIAIGANLMMFSILAAARTTPSLKHTEKIEPIRIISLEAPLTSPERTNREIVTDIVQLNERPVNSEFPEPTHKILKSTFPNLTERIEDVTFELPGLPVISSSLSLQLPPENTSTGSIGEPLSALSVDVLPSRIAGPMPSYPHWARREKLEAVVTLRFIVTEEGNVKDINIREIQGNERFGTGAIQAISQWRFNPAIKAGKPVSCWCFQKISFKFTD